MDRSKWEYKKLTDVCSILYGYPFDSKCFNENNQGRPLIRIRDVVRGFTETYTTEDCPDDYIIKEGEHLVGMDGEFNISAWKSDPALLNQRVCKITADGKNLTDGFMYYLMKTKLKEIEGETAFVTVKHLSAKVLSKVNIQLPSVEDQQRIVAELDCLNEMIAVKQEQLKEFDKLAQSIFYDMFGDPVANEKGWKIDSLNKVCNGIGDGLHGTPQYDENGKIAFINGNNLIDGKIVITERTQFVSEDEARKIYIELDPNTILLSINGTLGKTAIYNNEQVVLGKSACYLRLTNQLIVQFVMALMNTSEFMDFLESNSSQSTIKNVGLKAIRNYKIIIPPLALQQQFAEKISAIEAQKELVKQSIAETQQLFNSKMDYYFNE